MATFGGPFLSEGPLCPLWQAKMTSRTFLGGALALSNGFWIDPDQVCEVILSYDAGQGSLGPLARITVKQGNGNIVCRYGAHEQGTEAFMLNHAKALLRAAELNARLERTGSIEE